MSIIDKEELTKVTTEQFKSLLKDVRKQKEIPPEEPKRNKFNNDDEIPFDLRIHGKKILCQSWLIVNNQRGYSTPKLIGQKMVKAGAITLSNGLVIDYNAVKEHKKYYQYDYDVKTGLPLPFIPFDIEMQSNLVELLASHDIITPIFKHKGLSMKLFYIIAITACISTVTVMIVVPLMITQNTTIEQLKKQHTDDVNVIQQMQALLGGQNIPSGNSGGLQ